MNRTPENGWIYPGARSGARAQGAGDRRRAGGHSLLMAGPPGSGKTMLASRLATILPSMSENEALEVDLHIP